MLTNMWFGIRKSENVMFLVEMVEWNGRVRRGVEGKSEESNVSCGNLMKQNRGDYDYANTT